ncbi:MAG TPA: ABC transporter permease [Ilumatobacteraceae bacterium]|nr:ABC transporter permease [Ilumatobacteraceae bacterium]
MAPLDVTVDVGAASGDAPPEVAGTPECAAAPSKKRLLWGVLAVVVGVAACAAAGLIPTTAVVRIPLAVFGFGALVFALRLALVARGVRTPVGVVLATAWLTLIVLATITADWLPLAEARDPSKTLRTPILARPGLGEHLLGTDRQGLDLLGGIVYGSRVSLTVGVGAAVIAMIVGGAIGMVSGYFRGPLDRVIQFFMTSLLAFPPLILLMGLAAVLDPTVPNVTMALMVVVIPVFARVARASTLVVAQQDYIQAAKVIGATHRRILVRDVIPAIVQSLISYALVMVSMLVVAEASLSYLGLGIPRPEPTLGNIISAGKDQFNKHPHLVFGPALALFLTVLSLNLLGEHLRKLWDRREAKV